MAGRETLIRLARQGEALGHTLSVEQYGQGGVKFRAACSCGYSSTQRRTHALALGAGFHHLGKVAGEHSRNGGRLPPAPASDTPKITESSRTV